MTNRIYDALKEIRAEEQLKQSAYVFLQEKVYRKKPIAFKRFAVALVSILVVFAAGLFSYNLYFTETAIIDIDVNPSIEITLNTFDRVIGVYPYNDDGKKIVEEIDIRHKKYNEALEELIAKMSEMGYIKEAETITATIRTDDGEDEIKKLDSLKACIDAGLRAGGRTVEQDVFPVDSQTKLHSHEQNLTPAKYLAILELQMVDPAATFDGCRDRSISEIRRQASDHMMGGHETSGGEGGGEHGGNAGNDHGLADTGPAGAGSGGEPGDGHGADGEGEPHENPSSGNAPHGNGNDGGHGSDEGHGSDRDH